MTDMGNGLVVNNMAACRRKLYVKASRKSFHAVQIGGLDVMSVQMKKNMYDFFFSPECSPEPVIQNQ